MKKILCFDDFFAEYMKLKRKADKLNKLFGGAKIELKMKVRKERTN